MTVNRGEVYWFDLPEADDDDETITGSEQAERRPGIVLQKNHFNSRIGTTVIVPTTTGTANEAADYNSTIFISSSQECVTDDSIALCTQIRVVDVGEREDGQLGKLSQSKLREIEVAVQDVLDLF